MQLNKINFCNHKAIYENKQIESGGLCFDKVAKAVNLYWLCYKRLRLKINSTYHRMGLASVK